MGGVLIYVAVSPVPDISSFTSRQLDQSTKIYDRTGQVLLYDYNRDAKREIVPISNVSPNVINATIAIEDSSFYEHGGIRLTSIFRAMIADVLGGSLSQGGSTITQQVVKNTLLTNEKSIIRKIHEWVLAIKLEQVYSKNQILETYLNTIPFGGSRADAHSWLHRRRYLCKRAERECCLCSRRTKLHHRSAFRLLYPRPTSEHLRSERSSLGVEGDDNPRCGLGNKS